MQALSCTNCLRKNICLVPQKVDFFFNYPSNKHKEKLCIILASELRTDHLIRSWKFWREIFIYAPHQNAEEHGQSYNKNT